MAQEVNLLSSTGALASTLTGGLVIIVIAAYRFYVNFRTTERGMARQRIRQANQNERLAQHEAGLWQLRAADLAYLLKVNGIAVPPLDDELRKFIANAEEGSRQGDTVDWSGIGPTPEGRSGA